MIFNQGKTTDPARQGIPAVTLTANNTSGIPVIGTTYALGATLADTPGLRMRVFANTFRQILPTANVLAEKRGVNNDNVVMAGAHLDSVLDGPGINDNGSGSASILEAAEQLANIKPQNTIRFAWWGAEESGLVGSTNYVNGLSQAEKDRIALYLNFDMVGSPNYIFMVYDGNESSFPPPAGVPIPDGSEAIEGLFESFYTYRGEPYDDTQFSGRSDYQAFILNDIPAGGLFTGAEVIKTAEQAAIWGGTVGAQFDPCYHQACDTFANNNDHALEVNADSVAFSILTYAYSTESVNGVPGKKVPGNFRSRPRPARKARSFRKQHLQLARRGGGPAAAPSLCLRPFWSAGPGGKMPAMDVLLRVDAGPGAEPAETAELAERLRAELAAQEVDAEPVEADAPEGAKGAGVELGSLLVVLAASGGVLTSLVGTLQAWVTRQSRSRLVLEIDGDRVELTGASDAERSRALEAWLARHGDAGAADGGDGPTA